MKLKMKCAAFLRYESSSELPYQRFWETMKCSVYNFKNAQPLYFQILTPQVPPR